ncbi:MAG: phospho-N-acetylmuramoyl-pentapeptide-transferase [Lachnospiraceae bacterium]|nr:phospho-N-acetylmuramoyl-pentapeptide-transferase [Lachnospiraceae bacterium]
MFNYISGETIPMVAFIGVMFAFLATCFFIGKFNQYLPKDIGRDYAHDGKLSAGKPRGAGFIFILVFVGSTLLFAKLDVEVVIYVILIFAAMMTGFLDDASKAPWGEYKKGLLDLLIAIVVAMAYLKYNTNTILIAMTGTTITIPTVLFGILVVILVWTAINVTNCADGVDGLSGTLTIITLMSIYIANILLGVVDEHNYIILLFVVCILGYLWFNATPSKLLMGDAGSRAMGLFIAISILKTGSPLLYLLLSIVLLLDGGLGLVKVFLLRFLKIHILKNVRTPLHDQVRKVMGWSNTQTVFRFGIIQIVVSLATLYAIYLL